MFTPMMSPDLQLALAKARERKLQEQAATTRLLKQAGSKIGHVRPNTIGLFNLLLTSRL